MPTKFQPCLYDKMFSFEFFFVSFFVYILFCSSRFFEAANKRTEKSHSVLGFFFIYLVIYIYIHTYINQSIFDVFALILICFVLSFILYIEFVLSLLNRLHCDSYNLYMYNHLHSFHHKTSTLSCAYTSTQHSPMINIWRKKKLFKTIKNPNTIANWATRERKRKQKFIEAKSE